MKGTAIMKTILQSQFQQKETKKTKADGEQNFLEIS